MAYCKACDKAVGHACWRDGHVAVQETGPVIQTGALPYREYLCGRCGGKFRVPRCGDCGGATIKVVRNKALEVVASAEMDVLVPEEMRIRKGHDVGCRVVFFGLTEKAEGLRERVQRSVDRWVAEKRRAEEN